ncbi:MAG: hypothetical protein WBJ62_08015, partial [Coriobacteriia bacterium]
MKVQSRRVYIIVALALAIACFAGAYVAQAIEVVSPPVDPTLWNPGFTTYPVAAATDVSPHESFWTFWHPVGPPTGVDDGWTSGAIMRLHFDSVTSVDGAVGGA